VVALDDLRSLRIADAGVALGLLGGASLILAQSVLPWLLAVGLFLLALGMALGFGSIAILDAVSLHRQWRLPRRRRVNPIEIALVALRFVMFAATAGMAVVSLAWLARAGVRSLVG
jgi:hypothetical protein